MAIAPSLDSAMGAIARGCGAAWHAAREARHGRFAAARGRRSLLARLLVWFWVAVLTGLAGMALILQWLGPMPGLVPMPDSVPMAHPGAIPSARPAPGAPSGRIPPPIAALQEPLPGNAGLFLPRLATDGRAPMRAYAAPFDAADTRPRVGILLAGMGLNGADSVAAINTLPGGVTFAFSPYGQRMATLLEAARQRGQEFLVSLPMEPKAAPLHDAGDQALLAGATPEQNRRRLEWSLSRIGGYVGATGALGALHGERFAAAGQPMREVMQTLAARGLLYVDPRPGVPLPDGFAGRAVDLVIDLRQERGEIERTLRQLEQTARERGSALGLAGAPVPVTIGALAVWASGLEERGLVLAPVSALMKPPAAERVDRTERAH